MSSTLRLSPSPSPTRRQEEPFDNDTDDDAGSQRSISLSSPTTSVDPSTQEHEKDGPLTPQLRSTSMSAMQSATPKPPAVTKLPRENTLSSASSFANSTVNSQRSSDAYMADAFLVEDTASNATRPSTTYPPSQFSMDDASSMVSYSSSSSRKARPESNLLEPDGPLVPGICLVDFNHSVGPKVEFADGSVFEDEQIMSLMPFLALPDGAHLNTEDYSCFHLVPASASPTTVFGISCNRQIRASELLAKDEDVTRSTVQKAVVVLASKPLFGPIRDKLGVVTRALFEQRDFRETNILVDFRSSLELSLRTQLTESAFYMGTYLRELIHKFRGRTLVLLKALILQKRIMFYGHPVERLCTYQYSLISLIPGLLQNLDDCGSPPLASRAPTLSRATSLRTSDRKSLLAYLGLPLDIFGKDAFFQPYLPLQQVDMIKETNSWLCGSTNSIVTQQKEIDLLVNIETNTFEFRDSELERIVGLTAADRKWMDEIVHDVNEQWDDGPGRPSGLQFKGSEDYLRTKFEEYVTGALSSVKYADFLSKGKHQDVLISGADDGGDANAIQDFNPLWIAEFKKTNAFEVWQRITDPMLFDIIEARHPCTVKPSVVSDIGLRFQEGLQDLHLDRQLAPARDAVTRTLTTGSTSLFRAVEGVRGKWAQRSTSSNGNLNTASQDDASISRASTPSVISRTELDGVGRSTSTDSVGTSHQQEQPQVSNGLKPLSLAAAQTANDAKATLGAWSSSIGGFISQRAARFSQSRTDSDSLAGASSSNAGTTIAASSIGSAQSSTASATNTAASSPAPFSYALGRASILGSKLGATIGTGVGLAGAYAGTRRSSTLPPEHPAEDIVHKPRSLGESGSWTNSASVPGNGHAAAVSRGATESIVQTEAPSVQTGTAV